MFDFKLPIELPTIDLSQALPLIALVVLAVMILFSLLARSLIRSRAFALALVAAVVMLGNGAVVGEIGAFTTLIAVAGVVIIVGVIALGRNPGVLDLLHVVARRERATAAQLPPTVIDQSTPLSAAPHQSHWSAPGSISPQRRRIPQVIHLPKDSGF